MPKIKTGIRGQTLTIAGRKKVDAEYPIEEIITYLIKVNNEDCVPALSDERLNIIIKNVSNYKHKKEKENKNNEWV